MLTDIELLTWAMTALSPDRLLPFVHGKSVVCTDNHRVHVIKNYYDHEFLHGRCLSLGEPVDPPGSILPDIDTCLPSKILWESVFLLGSEERETPPDGEDTPITLRKLNLSNGTTPFFNAGMLDELLLGFAGVLWLAEHTCPTTGRVGCVIIAEDEQRLGMLKNYYVKSES